MKLLKTDRIYGWLYHRFADYSSGSLTWTAVKEIQLKYNIQKVGFSLYDPNEWRQLISDGVIPEVIQVPYNIFDRRFESIFPEAKAYGTEIHTRSAFLQGLPFKDADTLPTHFDSMKDVLHQIRATVLQHKLDLAACLLRFAAGSAAVDRVVFGVLNQLQLTENLSGFADPRNDLSHYMNLKDLEITDPQIINPANWP